MSRALASLIVLFLPSLAHAAEAEGEDDPSDDVRPVQYASVEANALGPAVDRYGGQVQVAVMGPLTLVGGMSRIENAAVSGWAAEVGSRLFFGLAPRRADGSRIAHVFLACSFLADDIRVGDTRGERRGVALDAGVHMRIAYGFYALGGVGIAHRSTDLVIPDRLEGMKTTPRLLLALGWGF
jgi:hypothetical protein